MSTLQKMKEEWFGFRSLRYLITGRAKCVICDKRMQTDGGFICDDCRKGISNLAERDALRDEVKRLRTMLAERR